MTAIEKRAREIAVRRGPNDADDVGRCRDMWEFAGYIGDAIVDAEVPAEHLASVRAGRRARQIEGRP